MSPTVSATRPAEARPAEGAWVDAPVDAALQAIARRDFQAAKALLERVAADAVAAEAAATAAPRTGEARVGASPSRPEAAALLALACFWNEHYDAAARHYAAALAAAAPDEPRRADWLAMQQLCERNAEAGVDRFVPDLHYFERAALLAPPLIADGTLPVPLPPPPRPGRLRRWGHRLGTLLGHVGTAIAETAMHAVGRLMGWRDAVWTNWYHRPKWLAILTLAYMRERLNARNLGSSYPPDVLVGFQAPNQVPPTGVTHFRTANGSWNNLADPMEGAAGTRFLRNVALSAIRPETGDQLMTPNPRLISRVLLSREPGTDGQPKMKEVPFLNLLAASWIQFMNHDWINHGEIHYLETIEVPLPEDDPARTRHWQAKMFIGRGQADPTRTPGEETAAYSAINEVTHWWDGSQLYGSDQATQDRLREHAGGRLRLQTDGRLPVADNGVEDTGFIRNWWVGLSMLHTLFAREHNAICAHLAAAYPEWEDNRLFNVARLINAAVMAKIHTIEWTPAILPNPALYDGMHANWYGLISNFTHRHGEPRKTLSTVKVVNPELGGVVGNPINKHGRGFGLTEEFTEVYRLHSLLPEQLHLRRHTDPAGAEPAEKLDFVRARQSGSPRVTARWSMADLFHSFGNQHPGQLVLNNFPRFLQELSIPGNPFFDMATVDIVRARERGVPRYNEFRRQLGLSPIGRFEDLTEDRDAVARLKQVYGADPADVEKLDLLVGTLSEGHRPTQFGFGETMFQVFLLNATRRLQADRFYTDCYDEAHYTPEGLRWIDETDFKTVILRHLPELADSGLANVRNAFEPWDSGPVLDPLRHPLRACDPATKDNPWVGESHRPYAEMDAPLPSMAAGGAEPPAPGGAA